MNWLNEERLLEYPIPFTVLYKILEGMKQGNLKGFRDTRTDPLRRMIAQALWVKAETFEELDMLCYEFHDKKKKFTKENLR